MRRNFLLFLAATVATATVSFIDGSTALAAAGGARLVLVLLLFLPVLEAGANILKGPPPI